MPDVVYKYTANKKIQLVVKITGPDGANANKSTLLTWDTNCPSNANSCQSKDFYADPDSSPPSSVSFCTDIGASYYFIVDSHSPFEVGPYQFHVKKGMAQCAGPGG
jgi:hypothetical protein